MIQAHKEAHGLVPGEIIEVLRGFSAPMMIYELVNSA